MHEFTKYTHAYEHITFVRSSVSNSMCKKVTLRAQTAMPHNQTDAPTAEGQLVSERTATKNIIIRQIQSVFVFESPVVESVRLRFTKVAN